jgi:hypothetical protein
MKIQWCVCSGPDRSHLSDVAWFKRLVDAKKFSRLLPVNPLGNKRDFKIERHEFKGDYL